MSNKIIKGELTAPYSEKQKIDFIVEYNHNQGCIIEEGDNELIAYTLEPTEEEKQQEERERLNNLFMTRGDVFEAFILAKGLTKASLRKMIEQAELDEITKALYLNRFDEALNFYRGFPVFDTLGQVVGITSKQLDKFFDTKDYKYLTTCTLTIKPTPTDAIVTGDGAYPYGSEVEYKVEADGYITKTGTVALIEDTTLEVVLDEDTTDTPRQDSLEGEAN